MTRETLTLMPEGIAGSVYSRYWTGGTAIAGYRTLADVIAHTLEAVRHAPGPSFTYCYLPLVDHAAHEHGAKGAPTAAAVRAVDRMFEALASELRDEAVVALSADHGHLDAAPTSGC